ncbi:hypothetical protein FA13DRAFT_1818384 [Coprinellus micaceus]|uniref:Nephrocystin 3-like N-terminal domain-containing protein n=1 Tax=Coprinellus micaceus TaxID=71717 RepID=A0A4Y7SNY6_COPMI|nr:hypothetical protein FA13DRAFT_1818384 [Coprinellus micaceus]
MVHRTQLYAVKVDPERPVEQVDYPNWLQTFFKDRYWAKPASEHMARGEFEAEQAERTIEMPFMPDIDKDLLNGKIKQFNECKAAYEAAVRKRNRKQSKRIVKDLGLTVSVLYDARKKSAAAARAIQMTREVQIRIKTEYAFISERSKDELILTSSRRKIPNSKALIPPEVAWHLMAWLNEGHITKRIHWLRGPRRCGKSTILYRFLNMCQDYAKPTGMTPAWIAGVAFDKSFTNDQIMDHFLPTIIHQIAERFYSVKERLHEIYHCWNREEYIVSTPFNEQVEDLFVALAGAVPRNGFSPIIIALDGLENCDSVALDRVFEFIEKTLEPASVLPIYFIVAAADEGTSKRYLGSSGLESLVEVNDLLPFSKLIERAPRPLKSDTSSSSSQGIIEVDRFADSGISVQDPA